VDNSLSTRFRSSLWISVVITSLANSGLQIIYVAGHRRIILKIPILLYIYQQLMQIFGESTCK
jgi:hypothetical protein